MNEINGVGLSVEELHYALATAEQVAQVSIEPAAESEYDASEHSDDGNTIDGEDAEELYDDPRDIVSLDPLAAGEASMGGEGSSDGGGPAFSEREALIQAFNNDPGEANLRKFDDAKKSGLRIFVPPRPAAEQSTVDSYDHSVKEGVDLASLITRVPLESGKIARLMAPKRSA